MLEARLFGTARFVMAHFVAGPFWSGPFWHEFHKNNFFCFCFYFLIYKIYFPYFFLFQENFYAGLIFPLCDVHTRDGNRIAQIQIIYFVTIHSNHDNK